MTMRLAVLATVDLGVLILAVATGSAWALPVHAVLTIAGYVLWLSHAPRRDFGPAMLGVLSPAALLAAQAVARRMPASTRPAMPLPDPTTRSGTGHRGASLAVARMLDGRVLHAAPDTLHSLVTVMRHGQVPERRMALETVVRSFQPSLSPLVALALTDGDQTIRALAAAASARVVQNLGLSRAALEAKGDDPEAVAALAALLADHGRANVLLSDSQRVHLREDALALLPPDTPDPVRVEALWAAGDYAAIDALVAARPDSDRTDAMAGATAWWRTESAA